jgi:hypothetical protein
VKKYLSLLVLVHSLAVPLLVPAEDDGAAPLGARIYRVSDLAWQPPARPVKDPRELPTPRPGDESGRDGLEEIGPTLLPGPVQGDFPALPPDPNEGDLEYLPPLEEELWHHGGSYLYEPEGERLNWPAPDSHEHFQVLRLPEDWQEPRPVTAFQEFLGADEVHPRPHLHWLGNGYRWEPRFVGYGSYQLFAFAFEENNMRRDAIGHQLIAELDLRLTGTERFHVQYRPIGERNTGGSYYQFSDPAGYVDNSTAVPERYWFEGEIHSMFGGFLNPFAAWDYHVVGGMYPLVLQNALLMNDNILGFAINKNNIYLGPLSNINVQAFAGFDGVDAFPDSGAQVFGTNVSIDYKRRFYELTYSFLRNKHESSRDSHYLALSRTSWHGMLSLAGRAMFKFGDEGGSGSGQLFVLESNYTRVFDHKPLGVEKGVFYANTFLATNGWRPIAVGNFNRITTAFEVNPLTQIAAGNEVGRNWGAVLGAQLFRHHEDESLIPEVAFQSPDDEPVFGVGLRYLRKTSARSFFEVLGTLNFSDDPQYQRRGIFLSETIAF